MSRDLVINIKIPRVLMGSGGAPTTIESKEPPPAEDPDPGFGSGDHGVRPRKDGGRRVVVVVDLDGEGDDEAPRH